MHQTLRNKYHWSCVLSPILHVSLIQGISQIRKYPCFVCDLRAGGFTFRKKNQNFFLSMDLKRLTSCFPGDSSVLLISGWKSGGNTKEMQGYYQSNKADVDRGTISSLRWWSQGKNNSMRIRIRCSESCYCSSPRINLKVTCRGCFWNICSVFFRKNLWRWREFCCKPSSLTWWLNILTVTCSNLQKS